MVYEHLTMEIYQAYELDLEGYTIQQGIEYNVIRSKIHTNAHFYGLHYDEPTTKCQKLKPGEKRVLGSKATISLKPVKPQDADQELASIVAKALARASQISAKGEAKKEPKKGKKPSKVPIAERERTQRKAPAVIERKPSPQEIEEEAATLVEIIRRMFPL